MGKSFIIRVRYGGLGDHLFYSHLPRIAKECGFDKVLISTLSEYRHDIYRELIWERNPFVDGFCDEDAPTPEFGTMLPGTNILDMVMILRGLDDGKRLHEPEIFYRPSVIPSLRDASIYDPNYVAFVGEISGRLIGQYIRAQGDKPDFILKPRPKAVLFRASSETLDTRDVFHYCDMIHSCRRFYCLTSGSATLAAALGKPAVAFYGEGQMKIFHHSTQHRYVQTGNITPYVRARRIVKAVARRGLRIARHLTGTPNKPS